MIIGLTGTFAAGKDAIAEYLMKKGFEHFSTGDEVREIAQEKKIELTRDNQRELANELRDKYGADYLTKRALKKAKTDMVAISGLRQPGEVKYLQSLKDFYLIAVDAPAKLRFERMRTRKREGDPETLEAFIEKENKELHAKGKNCQKINECMAMADFTIINDGDFDHLHEEIEKVLQKISKK